MATQSINGLTVPSFIPRYRVCIVPESRPAGPLVLIRDSAGAAAALRPFFAGLDREQFLVCCLDAKHAIIGVNVVSIGSLTLSIVHPREVFKPAILLNSCGVIAAHNHPSGNPTPSAEDRTLTARSGRPENSSASLSSITSFSVTTASTASQTSAGRHEAIALAYYIAPLSDRHS